MRVLSVYLQALDVTDPLEREAYVKAACLGDAAACAEVLKLLATDIPESAQFLNGPVALCPAGSASIPGDPVGESEILPPPIGPYRPLKKLGEGGMGVVYLAEQSGAVRRQVALKIIRTNLGSRDTLARFEAERQALALMDHSHIARVFDAGSLPDGRPYFVMEYVDGRPLNAFCRDEKLTLRDSLALFLDACHAIHHAHQKGVIHRDIKPSNLLVARIDGRPTVKVIDFGVAKATGERLTETTQFTRQGALVGTLEYMSPEQAGATDVDIRSDVYALGVVLYEMLAGQTPIDRERVRTLSLEDLLRVIREEDAALPSVRMASVVGAPAISGITARQVQGELDWIAMRALEKDRARRYGSALELARDVERHLRDEPVEASPPSAGYRIAKLVRRHRWPFTAAAILVVALLAGLGLTSLLFLREREARDIALAGEREQARLREIADAARRAADAARAEAEENARRAVSEAARNARMAKFLQDLLGGFGGGRASPHQALILKLLDDAMQNLEKELTGQPEVEANLLQVIGSTYLQNSADDRAEAALTRAVRLRRALPSEHRRDLTYDLYYLGMAQRDKTKAYDSLREAYDLQQSQPLPETMLRNMLGHMVSYSIQTGKFSDAERFVEKELSLAAPNDFGRRVTSLQLFASIYETDGRKVERRDRLQLLLAELERDVQTAGEGSVSPSGCAVISGIYGVLGDVENSLAYSRKEIEHTAKVFGAEHAATGAAMFKVGQLFESRARYDEALQMMREGFRLCRAGWGDANSGTFERARWLADVLQKRGDAAQSKNDLDLASALYSEALGLAEQFYPATVQANRLRGALGSCRLRQGIATEAEFLLLQAYRGLAGSAEATQPENQTALALIAGDLADLYYAMSQAEKSAEWSEKAK